MRILIISHVHPPYNTIGAVRVGKTARYLVELGHQVRVVAADLPAIEYSDASLPIEIEKQWVSFVPFWDPNRAGMAALKGLQRVRARRRAGGASAQTQHSYVGSLKSLPAFLRAPAWLYTTFMNFPDRAIGWYVPALRAALRLAADFQPDIVFASGGPFTTLLVGAAVARKTGLPWVADLRDLWTDNHVYKPRPGRAAAERWLERTTLSSARGLTTVSEPWAQLLRDKYGLPVETITNGFDPSDFPAPSAPDPQAPLHIVFTGRLYGGLCDPTPFFKALAQLHHDTPVRVDFFLRDDHAPIRAMLRATGVEHLVQLHAPVPYQQALQAQASADLLLLPLHDEQGFFSGKVFEYIGARRSIVVLGDAANVAAQLVTSRGLGIASRDPNEIAAYLRSTLAKKRAGDGLLTSDTSVQQLTRKAQAEKLAGFMQRLLQSTPLGA